MTKSMGWKLALILGLVALSVFSFSPPSKKVKLGLDLRGGSHIVMQVETGSAVKNETNLAVSRVGQALKDKTIDAKVFSPASGVLEIEGADPARSADVKEVLTDWVGQWSTSDRGGGSFRSTMGPDVKKEIAAAAIEATLETLRERIDGLGVSEPIIQKQGALGDRIVVQLPGLENFDQAKDMLRDPALLEWKAVVYPPGVADFGSWAPPTSREQAVALYGGTLPPGTDLYAQRVPLREGGSTTYWWPLNTVSVVVGKDLRSVRPSTDEFGRHVVSFTLSQEAGKRFERATAENVGRVMAIVLGGSTNKQVISAPVIQSTIRDSGQISGSFTAQSARDLSLKLMSGSIPVDVSIIEERTVGPSLGRDSIRSGVFASIIGFVLVAFFMLAYYRGSGINAVVALMMNVVLVLGVMSQIKATLTLPGIAGLILTVGMAVDSNILIFERIREELRNGKVVRTAVDQGFSKAFSTIIDTHVTTLVSATFLGWFGTGPVRGFAVTLIIGLILSMFTAVFVSRVIYDLVLGDRKTIESLSI